MSWLEFVTSAPQPLEVRLRRNLSYIHLCVVSKENYLSELSMVMLWAENPSMSEDEGRNVLQYRAEYYDTVLERLRAEREELLAEMQCVESNH